MHAELVKQLCKVNSDINNTMSYISDLEQYNKMEFWPDIPGKEGDCEDYARAKELQLRKLGWDRNCMGRATCYPKWNLTQLHCVLLVNTDQGTYVLDLHKDEPLPWLDADIERWVSVPDYIKLSVVPQ